MEEHKTYLDEIKSKDEMLRSFTKESFFQIVKNRLGWTPNYYDARKDARLQGLEKALRDRGTNNHKKNLIS
jgi:hypothetical protein